MIHPSLQIETMTYNNHHEQLLSPRTDELLCRLEKLSKSRLDDQRTEMPWMVAEGVAAIGWKIPNRPPRTNDHREPISTHQFIHQLQQLPHDNDDTLMGQPAGGLSSLLLAYHSSIERSGTADPPSLKYTPLPPRASSHDGLFFRKLPKNDLKSISKPRPSKCSDQSNTQESTEIFDEQSALLTTQPSHPKLSLHLKSRLCSPSMPSFHCRKVQSGQVRVSEDYKRTLV